MTTSTPVTFKKVIPKPLQTQAMLNVLMNECQKVGKEMVEDFEKTTETWQGDKPEFYSKVLVEPQNAPHLGQFPHRIMVEVGPKEEESTGAKKWFFLNYGTRVRRAVMSKDFAPKTTPHILGSGPGAGRMVFVSKKINLPGIKARKWNIALRRKWDKEWYKRMFDTLYPVVQVSGYSARVGPSGGLF